MFYKCYAITLWNDGLITGRKWKNDKFFCQQCHKKDLLHLVKWPNIVHSYECRECIERHMLRIGLTGQIFWANLEISDLPKWIVEKLTYVQK